MILLRRIIPFLSPLILFSGFFGLWLHPQDWRVWSGGLLFTVFFSVAFLMQWKWRTREFWAVCFPILSFIIGGVGLLLFFESVWIQLAFAFTISILFGTYLENIFIFYYQPQRYSRLSIPNLSFFLLLFSIFSLFTTIFAIQFVGLITRWMLILEIPPGASPFVSQGLLALVGFLFGMAVMAHMLWSYKLLTPEHRYAIPFFGLICAQLIWIFQYLPVAFYVNGMWITIIAYAVLACTQLHFRKILTRRLLVQYVVIALVASALILGTSQWT